jgi:hypothetical protein
MIVQEVNEEGDEDNSEILDHTWQGKNCENEERKNSEEEEPAGFFGFFKKTFSSVKKTFESTFN